MKEQAFIYNCHKWMNLKNISETLTLLRRQGNKLLTVQKIRKFKLKYLQFYKH